MVFKILGLPIDTWVIILLIGFVIIAICNIITTMTTYSISIKITEIMQDTIKISEENDNKVENI